MASDVLEERRSSRRETTGARTVPASAPMSVASTKRRRRKRSWREFRERSERKQSPDARLSFACGAVASIFTKVLLQPLDTLKTLAQLSKPTQARLSMFRSTSKALVLGSRLRHVHFRFVREGAQLVSRNGVAALFRGLPASLVVSAPSSAVFFSIYDPVKSFLSDRQEMSIGVSSLVAATAGNLVSSLIRVPPENIKQNIQAGLYPNGLQAVRTVMKSPQGLRALYRGYSAQLLKDIPYSAVQFSVYNWIKTKAAKRKQIARESGGDGGFSDDPHEKNRHPCRGVPSFEVFGGALAGALAVLVTSPLDVIKTRMMTSSLSLLPPRPGDVCGSLVGVFQVGALICRQEGPRALFQGLVPRLLQKVPASAFYLITYDYLLATSSQAMQREPHHS